MIFSLLKEKGNKVKLLLKNPAGAFIVGNLLTIENKEVIMKNANCEKDQFTIASDVEAHFPINNIAAWFRESKK